ncbi:UDP-N-acetylmuramoyl-L-alanyl-D-glutamate--2,6-diaminopimelate ligase [Lentisphaerota bacterium WC36G]|nr:UDP-N-acetylmuramoyl-L-alanyl-D-glutamate--2,6-diaminopimelate ligase [Lentisphaerae bacterium WC36]
MKIVEDLVKVIQNYVIELKLDSDKKQIKSLSNNSRKVRPNYVFVAIKGFTSDGHQFIEQAIEAGANTIIYSQDLKKYHDEINYIKVTDTVAAYNEAVAWFFDYPAEKLKVIGVTGTNGKTTTAFIIELILNSLNNRCGLISTVKHSSILTQIAAERTTPEAFFLQQLFAQMVEDECHNVVMEVSSHALEQKRVGNTKFAVGIFSNLSGDHLDYHHSMENYYNAKKTMFINHISDEGIIIINHDCEYGQKLLKELVIEKKSTQKLISYGFNPNADFVLSNFSSDENGSSFYLKLPEIDEKLAIEDNLIGEYNALNLTAAIIAVNSYGYEFDEIIKIIAEENFVIPGRLERFQLDNGATVFIDYAHSDDALKNVLMVLRKICVNKLSVIFGCGGDRDKTKRPRMGKIANQYADKVFLTTDNPRSENPSDIINDIKEGIDTDCDLYEIENREAAIQAALNQAETGDIVLIAGKGHETYQIIGDEKIFFDDSKVVKKFIDA